MKKIIKGKGDIRINGYSGVNCITLNSIKVTETFAFRTSVSGRATVDENENIISEKVDFTDVKTEMYDSIKNRTEKTKVILMITSLVCMFLSLPVAFLGRYFSEIAMSLFFLLWGCSLIPDAVVMLFLRIRGDSDAISLSKFHSAEHAVINAYYDLGRVPTIEEIRNYSNFSYYCGSLEKLKKASYIFGFAIARLLPGLWYLLGLIIIEIVIFILNKNGKIYFMEFLVTSEPTEREYKVAIAALEKCIEISQDMVPDEFSVVVQFMTNLFSDALKHSFSPEKCRNCPNYDLCSEKSNEEKENE